MSQHDRLGIFSRVKIWKAQGPQIKLKTMNLVWISSINFQITFRKKQSFIQDTADLKTEQSMYPTYKKIQSINPPITPLISRKRYRKNKNYLIRNQDKQCNRSSNKSQFFIQISMRKKYIFWEQDFVTWIFYIAIFSMLSILALL
jgi:hypothetical protein